MDETEIPLNDIYPFEEKTDVDMSGIFVLSKLQVQHLLGKKNLLDLQKQLKPQLNFSLHPKLKLFKLQHPFFDLKKVKKHKDIILRTYVPKRTPYTLDLQDLEILQNIEWPYPDLHKTTFAPSYKTYFFLKKFWKNTKNIFFMKKTFVYFWAIFSVFFMLFLYKTLVEVKLYRTFENIKNIEVSSDISQTKEQIASLRSDFFTLRVILQPVFLLNRVVNIQDVTNLEYLITWGNNILSSAVEWFYLYDSLLYNIQNKWVDEVYFWDFFLNSLPTLQKISNGLNSWVEVLWHVQFPVWDPIGNIFDEKLQKLQSLQSRLWVFLDHLDMVPKMLGNEKKRKYMIIFQNNDELRPTWGFMGSVMFVEVYRGKIISQEKKDIYALEWPLKPFTQIAPEGLHKITPTFGLRDANYYVEIEKSSQEIQKFLKKSDISIDGIVYINQQVIRDLLTLTGEVEFPAVKTKINSDNFSQIFSLLVESKIFKEGTLWTPKQVLFDFIPVFFSHLQTYGNYPKIAESVVASFHKRDILFWSALPEENTYLQNIGLKDDISDYGKYFDFAYPYFTSISGNKSDRYIQRNFYKTYETDQNCTLTTRLKIESKHLFWVNDELFLKNFLYDMDMLGKVELAKTLFIQGKWENKQYVRVYIPKDAILAEIEGATIKQLEDKKQVSFYLSTPLNTTRSFEFSYQIANPECQTYRFDFIKQAGLGSYFIEIKKKDEILHQMQTDTDYTFQERK